MALCPPGFITMGYADDNLSLCQSASTAGFLFYIFICFLCGLLKDIQQRALLGPDVLKTAT